MNWMGARLDDDSFGITLLQGGVSSAAIRDFVRDPQVPDAEGRPSSLFDLLENLDASVCLRRTREVAKRVAALPDDAIDATGFNPFKSAPPPATGDPAGEGAEGAAGAAE